MSKVLKILKSSMILPVFREAYELSILKENVMVEMAINKARELYVNNPYHNFTHAALVACFINKYHKTYNISSAELPYVLVAAIFHDAGHSGSYALPNSDKFNVFCSEYYCIKFLKSVHAPEAGITVARRALNCTQFVNNSFPVEPIFDYQKAIRDADILSMIEYDVYFDLLQGLTQEMKSTVDDAFLKHVVFLTNHTYYTSFARDLAIDFALRIMTEYDYGKSS